MKDSIHVNDLMKYVKGRSLKIWLDKLNFKRIFLLWISIVLMFGLIYYTLGGNDTNYLFNNLKNEPATRLVDAVYFSFVTATTIGFGDVIPMGGLRIIAIFEVVSCLLLLATVTSKLVSIKQDVILDELYEMSFNEKINRLRASLLLFRQNASRIITRVEEGAIKGREIKDIYIYVASLEDVLNEIRTTIQRPKNTQFTRKMDPVDTELVFNSVLSSLDKLSELITVANENKIDWKRDLTLDLISRCIVLNDKLFDHLNSTKPLLEKTIENLNARKNEIIKTIRAEMKSVPSAELEKLK